FQAEDGIRDATVTGVQTCALPIFRIGLERQFSHLWNQGSVVRSWLLELAELAFQADPKLAGIKGWVADSGEGRWTVLEAMEHDEIGRASCRERGERWGGEVWRESS